MPLQNPEPPQSLAASPLSHVFTLEQANRAIAYVRRVVADISESYQRLQKLTDQDGRLDPKAEAERGRLTDRLSHLLAELELVGCDLRDFESAEVQFLGTHHVNGIQRDVLWCWRPSDETITHWRDPDATRPGLRPLALLASSVATKD